MKRKITFLVMLLAFALYGCAKDGIDQEDTKDNAEYSQDKEESEAEQASSDLGADSQESVSQESDDVSVEEESLNTSMDIEEGDSIDPLNIEQKELEKTYDVDGVQIAKVRICYPEIENSELISGVEIINEYFQENASALFDECDVYATDAIDMYHLNVETGNQEDVAYTSYSLTYEVTYNANGILSLLEEYIEESADLEQPNSYHTGYVFKVSSGTQYEIGEILVGSDNEISERIGQEFLASDEISEEIKESAQNEILNNTDYADFYLDKENLCVFYDSYLIGPYSKGMLKANISLEKQDSFKFAIPVIQ